MIEMIEMMAGEIVELRIEMLSKTELAFKTNLSFIGHELQPLQYPQLIRSIGLELARSIASVEFDCRDGLIEFLANRSVKM